MNVDPCNYVSPLLSRTPHIVYLKEMPLKVVCAYPSWLVALVDEPLVSSVPSPPDLQGIWKDASCMNPP